MYSTLNLQQRVVLVLLHTMAPSSLAKVCLNVTAQVCSNLQNSFINEMNLGTIHQQQHTGLRVTLKSTLILHVMNETFPSRYI